MPRAGLRCAALAVMLGCQPEAPPAAPPAPPRGGDVARTSDEGALAVETRVIEALSVIQRPAIRAELEALTPDARQLLLTLVDAPATPPLARQRALSVLGEWPGDDAIGALFEAHLRDPEAPIARRVRMLRLLAESHPERAVPALRWAACQADAQLLAGVRRARERLPEPRRAAVDEAFERCREGGV